MNDVVTVAVDHCNPPFSRTDLAGEPRGFSIDLIRLALGHTGVNVEFRPVEGPVSQMLWLAAGRVDAAGDITVTERRKRWFAFSQWYHMEELMLFGLRDGPLWPGFRAFRGRLAVKVNSYVQEYLIRHHPSTQLLIVDSTEAELAALREGRASHIAVTRETGLALIAEEQAGELIAEGTPFGPAPLALATLGDSDTAVIERFDRGLVQLRRDGRLTRLEQQWLSAFARA